MVDFLLMFGILSFYVCFVVLFTKAWIYASRWICRQKTPHEIDFLFTYFLSFIILFMCSFGYWVAILEHTKFMF